MINCVLAKNVEFVVAGFRFLKVRTCIDLVVLTHVTPVKIKHDRFALESVVSKIYIKINIWIHIS